MEIGLQGIKLDMEDTDSWKKENERDRIHSKPSYLHLLFQLEDRPGPPRSGGSSPAATPNPSVASSSSSSAESVIHVFTFDDDAVNEKASSKVEVLEDKDQSAIRKNIFLKNLGQANHGQANKLVRSKSWHYPRKLPSQPHIPRSMDAVSATPFAELRHLLVKNMRPVKSACSFQKAMFPSSVDDQRVSHQHCCSAADVHVPLPICEYATVSERSHHRLTADNENWYRLYLEAKRTRQGATQEPEHCFPCTCSNTRCDGKMAPLAKKDCRTWLWKVSERGNVIERYGLSNVWKKDNRMWLWKTTNPFLRKQRRKDIRVLTEIKMGLE